MVKVMFRAQGNTERQAGEAVGRMGSAKVLGRGADRRSMETKTITKAEWQSMTTVAPATMTTGVIKSDGETAWAWVSSGKRVTIRRVS